MVRTCCIVGVAFRIRYSASRDGCRGNLGVPTEGACPGLEGAWPYLEGAWLYPEGAWPWVGAWP